MSPSVSSKQIEHERPCKKKRPVLVAENGPKAKKAYPKTSLDKSI